jgi:hypothetical protein
MPMQLCMHIIAYCILHMSLKAIHNLIVDVLIANKYLMEKTE